MTAVLAVKHRRLRLPKGLIGLVSDTHGLVRPQALAALHGSELIIHAGDIGKPEVLDVFAALAPVLAIRGNNDRDAWAKKLPEALDLRLNGARVYVIHDIGDLDFDPAAEGIQAVVSGHSHKPSTVHRSGVLFINPGSAGPRRFTLPVAVGKLCIRKNQLRARTIDLQL